MELSWVSSRAGPWKSEMPNSPAMPGADPGQLAGSPEPAAKKETGVWPEKGALGFHPRKPSHFHSLSLWTGLAVSRESASCHFGVNNHYSPEFILLITDTVPEDFPDKPELDHGLDGTKSLPGFGSMPFLIFIPSGQEMIFRCKIHYFMLNQIPVVTSSQNSICLNFLCCRNVMYLGAKTDPEVVHRLLRKEGNMVSWD